MIHSQQLEVFSSQQCEESKQNIERMKAQTPHSTMKTLIRKKSMQNLKDLFAVDAVFAESSGGEGEDGDGGIQFGESRSSSRISRKSNTGKDFHRDYFQDNFAGHAHALSRRKKNEWSFFFSKR